MTKRLEIQKLASGYIVQPYADDAAAWTDIKDALRDFAARAGHAIVVTDAPPVVQSKEDGEWIDHTPGGCPVPDDTMIAAVRDRAGWESDGPPRPASALYWGECGAYTTAAYKVKQ